MTEQPVRIVETKPRGGYGLWQATAQTPTGERVTGYGWRESGARANALVRAQKAAAGQQSA